MLNAYESPGMDGLLPQGPKISFSPGYCWNYQL
uniref:Clone 1291 transcribed RNA sequence n=1 Tax=Plectreurys tristis TaxID=33319 RepID=A0A0C4W9Y1_PLETR|nr:hypothetical protein [Plectreurys tristis]